MFELTQASMVVFNSASSGGGGGRGAPQHYPKTASNRYVISLFELARFQSQSLIDGECKTENRVALKLYNEYLLS